MLQQLLLTFFWCSAGQHICVSLLSFEGCKREIFKKKPSDPNTSRQNTINSVRGSGGGGEVLMAKNLLKKNIIKALIGSSVKGI